MVFSFIHDENIRHKAAGLFTKGKFMICGACQSLCDFNAIIYHIVL